MTRLIGSMSTTAFCRNMASNGDLPGMAPHIVAGVARYIAGATRLRMSIHMSLASVVAHTMGLQLSGFAQSPFLYSGYTRFALDLRKRSTGLQCLRGIRQGSHAGACRSAALPKVQTEFPDLKSAAQVRDPSASQDKVLHDGRRLTVAAWGAGSRRLGWRVGGAPVGRRGGRRRRGSL